MCVRPLIFALLTGNEAANYTQKYPPVIKAGLDTIKWKQDKGLIFALSRGWDETKATSELRFAVFLIKF